MTHNFKVNDEVYWTEDRIPIELEKLTGKEIEYLSKGKVKFVAENELGVCSNYSYNNQIYSITPNKAYLKSDIDAKKDALQKEFEKIQEEVAAKIQAGVELIRQAQLKMEGSGFDLIENYDISRPIRNMIDNLGWSSSSLSC